MKTELTLGNKHGIHGRSSAALSKLASTFPCDIYIYHDGKSANAKSIIELMMLCASHGAIITLSCVGLNEENAIDEISNLIKNNFFESE